MPAAKALVYSSPPPAKKLAEVFGDKGTEVIVSVRDSKDVPKYLAKLVEIRKKTAQSKLRFK